MLLECARLPQLDNGRQGAGGLQADEYVVVAWFEIEFKNVATVGLFLGSLRQAVATAPFVYPAIGVNVKETNVVKVGRHHLQPTRGRVILVD
ncbi:MAG: hypothetical protein Q7U45_02100 [Burkholderiaceae bacterium]|nr:hypothetical protein [Burkholderiaceae bacterium]